MQKQSARPLQTRQSPPAVRHYRPNLWQIGAVKEYRHIEIYEVALAGRYAFACTIVQGLQIYDISKPNTPKEHGEFRFPLPYGGYGKPGCRHLALDDKLAFVSNSSNAFQPLSFIAAMDISEPAKPQALRYFTDKRFNFGGLAADQGRVYAAAHKQGLVVLDLLHHPSTSQPTPARPRQRPTSQRTPPRPGPQPTTRPQGRPGATPNRRKPPPRKQIREAKMAALAQTIKRTARLSHGTNTRSSKRHRWQLVAHLQSFRNVQSVTRSARYLYIADGPAGLKIALLPPPSQRGQPGHRPVTIVGHARTPGFARRVAIHRGYAYVSQGHSGFSIFDVRQPKQPKRIAHVPTAYSVIEIALDRHFAFVANWNDLRIYDVREPGKPRLIAARALPKRKDTYRLPYEQSLTQIRNTSLAVRGTHIILGEWVGLRTLAFRPTPVPIADVATQRVDFVGTSPGKEQTQHISIHNLGQATLVLKGTQITPSKSPFQVGHKTLAIPAGQARSLRVTYRPSRAGAARASLQLSTNDPHRPQIKLDLVAAPRARRGTMHRDFVLDDVEGTHHRLSALRGKVIFLSYFATF